MVTAHYFQTVGLRLIRGRLFGPEDYANGHAAIINETMARRFFPDRDPIGRRWTTGEPMGPDAFEIVGVVSDAHYRDLRSTTPNAAYRLAAQTDEFLTSVEVRTSGPAAEPINAVRLALAAVHPRLPVMEVSTSRHACARSPSTSVPSRSSRPFSEPRRSCWPAWALRHSGLRRDATNTGARGANRTGRPAWHGGVAGDA